MSSRYELIVALFAVCRAAGWHATITRQTEHRILLDITTSPYDQDEIPAHVQALADLYDAQEGGK